MKSSYLFEDHGRDGETELILEWTLKDLLIIYDTPT